MRGFLQTVSLFTGKFVQTVALVLCLAPGTAGASPAPAGTMIRNIAESTYFNPRLGIVETVRSNPVEARVAAVPDLVVQGFTDLLLSRGALGQYYFEVVNSGNTPLATTLRMDDRVLPALTQQGRLVEDANGNGLIDAGDQAPDPAQSRALQPGERLSLIYAFAVSSGAMPGQTLESALVVEAAPQGVTAAALSAEAIGTTGIVSATLELEKIQSARQDDDGAILEYTLRLRNNSEEAILGYSAFDGTALRIDGVQARGVLVTDRIPLNSRFHSIVQNGGMTPLYHQRGDAPNDFLRQVPALENVDAIAFFHDGDYPVGRSGDRSLRCMCLQNWGMSPSATPRKPIWTRTACSARTPPSSSLAKPVAAAVLRRPGHA